MLNLQRQNLMIITAAIDSQFGAGAYEKVKHDPMAVEDLLVFIQNRKVVKRMAQINQPETIIREGVYHAELL